MLISCCKLLVIRALLIEKEVFQRFFLITRDEYTLLIISVSSYDLFFLRSSGKWELWGIYSDSFFPRILPTMLMTLYFSVCKSRSGDEWSDAL